MGGGWRLEKVEAGRGLRTGSRAELDVKEYGRRSF